MLPNHIPPSGSSDRYPGTLASVGTQLRIALCAVLLLAVAGCSSSSSNSANEQSDTTAAAAESASTLPADVQQAFLKSCRDTAKLGAPLAAAEIEAGCACSLAEIEKRYDVSDLERYATAIGSGEASDIDMRAIAASCGFDAAPAPTPTSGSGSSSAGEEYPAEVRDTFVKACAMNAANVSGQSESSHRDQCVCLLTELEKRYSYDEFLEADRAAIEGRASKIDFTELAPLCV